MKEEAKRVIWSLTIAILLTIVIYVIYGAIISWIFTHLLLVPISYTQGIAVALLSRFLLTLTIVKKAE